VRHFCPLRNHRFFCSHLHGELLVERFGYTDPLDAHCLGFSVIFPGIEGGIGCHEVSRTVKYALMRARALAAHYFGCRVAWNFAFELGDGLMVLLPACSACPKAWLHRVPAIRRLCARPEQHFRDTRFAHGLNGCNPIVHKIR
jgi:hypothetical protein